MLHQDVAAVLGELCVLHLKHLKAEGAALFLDGLFHRGRAELVDLGRQQRAPTRLAIARLFHQHHPRTPLQNRRQFHARIGESEQFDIELLRHLAKQIVDAYGAAMRQRIGKVRREHGHTAAARACRRGPPLRDSRTGLRNARASSTATTVGEDRCGPAARRARTETRPDRNAGDGAPGASCTPESCAGPAGRPRAAARWLRLSASPAPGRCGKASARVAVSASSPRWRQSGAGREPASAPPPPCGGTTRRRRCRT